MTLLKTLTCSIAVALSLPLTSAAQDAPDACTSIMVGREASVDGSVITSHNCDSWYRTWMQVQPAQDYPRDTVTAIYGGRMHTEYPSSMDGVTERGRIP